MTSAANAAMTHELCDHAGMSDSAMVEHAGHMMAAAGDEDDKDTKHHHDGCCDGVCLCNTTVSAGMSPETPDLGEPHLRSQLALPVAEGASDVAQSFDLPPPRLG